MTPQEIPYEQVKIDFEERSCSTSTTGLPTTLPPSQVSREW